VLLLDRTEQVAELREQGFETNSLVGDLVESFCRSDMTGSTCCPTTPAWRRASPAASRPSTTSSGTNGSS
jgi:hypothetical protein